MRIAVSLMALLISSAAFGQTSMDKKRALNELQSEMMSCMAYYQMTAICAPEAKKAEAEKLISPAIDRLTEYSFSVGKAAGLKSDVMLSRLNTSFDSHRKMAGDSCENVSSLVARFGDRCKQVVENGDQILKDDRKK